MPGPEGNAQKRTSEHGATETQSFTSTDDQTDSLRFRGFIGYSKGRPLNIQITIKTKHDEKTTAHSCRNGYGFGRQCTRAASMDAALRHIARRKHRCLLLQGRYLYSAGTRRKGRTTDN